MKNKGLIVVLSLSFILITFLIYINYFNNELYINNLSSYEKLEVFSKYKNEKASACYGNKYKCKPIEYKIMGSVNNKKLGTYIVSYKVKKKDEKLVKEKKIEVVDTKRPKLDIMGDFSNVCPNGKTNDVTYSAVDNYDGDITKDIKYKVKDNKIIYKVSDSSGNTTKKEFDAVIKDDEMPSLILNGDSTIYLAKGNKYEEPGYVAIDNCDGNITKNVKIKGNIDTKKVGTYELTYSVEDKYGNKNVVKRTVIVFPKNNYKPGVKTSKTIYLTFDDGPGAHTERLLDILKKYDVKATFFITGYDNRYNELITREYNEGHTIGLHSYSHDYKVIYSSVENFMNDMKMLEEKVKNYTGTYTKIIRFPGGTSNTISRNYKRGIMSELSKMVEEMGYRYFDWTIVSGDAGETTNPDEIYENVTSTISDDGYNVVLMHDIKYYTVDAIERIVQFGLSNGYTFAPLTMDSPVIHQGVNN